MIIEQHSIDEWLSNEKPYKIKMVKELLKNNNEEETAKLWLITNGIENTKSFGGSQTSLPKDTYWNRFRQEFDMFLCGHPKYQSVRDSIVKNGNIVQISSSALISSAIANYMGIASCFISVPVVLMLDAFSRIALNAYCKNFHFKDK
ncbi:hypothetical protein [Prevotella sp. AGR2160]|uniref:hypothetical protein n=1 Tax=Prevotella sp. AGR2160 TaxID=1280674 RepID=UPI00048C4394|nr:hypothetical protein [Prevotella sp. AGR2160]